MSALTGTKGSGRTSAGSLPLERGGSSPARLIHHAVSRRGGEAGEPQRLPPRDKGSVAGIPSARGLFSRHAWEARPGPRAPAPGPSGRERREAREPCRRRGGAASPPQPGNRSRPPAQVSAAPPQRGTSAPGAALRGEDAGPARLGSAEPAPGFFNGHNGGGAAVTRGEDARAGKTPAHPAPAPAQPPAGRCAALPSSLPSARRGRPAAPRCAVLTMLPAAVYLASGTPPAPCLPTPPPPPRPPPTPPPRLRANSRSPARGAAVTAATGGAVSGPGGRLPCPARPVRVPWPAPLSPRAPRAGPSRSGAQRGFNRS